MKFMGSKRWMLSNGLAEVIHSRVSKYDRFVDLFCGSALVSWHVSSNYQIPVQANDLQEFCRILAASVICRTQPLKQYWIDNWVNKAISNAHDHPLFSSAKELEKSSERINIEEFTSSARELCVQGVTPITAAYGGYYFSPLQAIQLDALRLTVPVRQPYQDAALASLIQVGSVCAASPGHTAQPYRPTLTAEPHLREAWSRSVFDRVRQNAAQLSKIKAKSKGVAFTSDANSIANDLQDGDLVFIDPPYSAVHYSRFYHVLETLAIGNKVNVSGKGRYPPQEQRPRSRYSLPAKAHYAFKQLLETIGKCRAGVIITFPAREASNGISGSQVYEIARQWFSVDCVKIKGRFSTLGGNTINRSARVHSEEFLFSLSPK